MTNIYGAENVFGPTWHSSTSMQRPIDTMKLFEWMQSAQSTINSMSGELNIARAQLDRALTELKDVKDTLHYVVVNYPEVIREYDIAQQAKVRMDI